MSAAQVQDFPSAERDRRKVRKVPDAQFPPSHGTREDFSLAVAQARHNAINQSNHYPVFGIKIKLDLEMMNVEQCDAAVNYLLDKIELIRAEANHKRCGF